MTEAMLQRDLVRDEYALFEKRVRFVVAYRGAPYCNGCVYGQPCVDGACIRTNVIVVRTLPLHAVRMQAAHLRREKAALVDEANAIRTDPEEAAERLMNKVKEDTSRIQALDRAIKDTEAEIAAKRKVCFSCSRTTTLLATHQCKLLLCMRLTMAMAAYCFRFTFRALRRAASERHYDRH